MVIPFPILKDRSEGESKRPIVPSHFGNTVPAAWHKAGVVVGLLGRFDNRGNGCGGHSLGGQKSGQRLFKLAGELGSQQAEIDGLGQAGRSILNIQARSERNPIEQPVGYGRLYIERRKL